MMPCRSDYATKPKGTRVASANKYAKIGPVKNIKSLDESQNVAIIHQSAGVAER